MGNNRSVISAIGIIPEGAEMLVLAHRPFPSQQPYAETGPIFLCAEECDRHLVRETPEILTCSPDYLVKGYSAEDRIVYGTGKIVNAADRGGPGFSTSLQPI